MLLRALYFTFAIIALSACGGETPVTEETIEGAPDAPMDEGVGSADDWGDAVDGLERRGGFVDLYIDKDEGRVLAAFPQADENGICLRAIYATGLTAGLGSNPIGLDRGLFDSGSLVAFRRIGGKVVVEQENWRYRASAENPLEQKAVRESFAPSFLWAGEVIAENDEAVLVDLSSFLTRDALDIRGTLKNHSNDGGFSVDGELSMPDLENALTFPDNVEFDAFMTMTSNAPGEQVIRTAAEPRSFTLVQHHSLVRLPEDGFRPRAFDPRSGAIDIPYYDFSAPLDGKVRQAFARRYRLEKEDPMAARSPAKEPIIFYVDSGAPEQIKNALVEGARWWNDAFEAAGFENAYRVDILPENAHPRDIRYNVIQWTHRQTRGWSYGGGVSDPRTGEMIKGSVILGSQRVRQDRMIFEGLAGAGKTGSGAADDPVEIALARIRQLSAHEVGHALGFAHNFAASSNERASVMDYPAPDIRVGADGALDFSNAYGVGVGDWDKLAATWLYAEFPEGADEATELDRILREGYARGLRFVVDRDGRSVGTAHPYGSVWDNGEDAVAMLEETMRVRRIALNQFGARSIKDGEPLSDLRNVIVPIYLYHRYQVAAAAKLVGGFDYNYGLKGDGSGAGDPVSPARQRGALTALLKTIDPVELDLPSALLDRLTPAADGAGLFGSAGENFDGAAGPMFDLLSASDTAAGLTMGALLHPARAGRLVEYERRDPNAFGLGDVLDGVEQTVFAEQDEPQRRAIARRLQARFVSSLIELSVNEVAPPAVKTAAEARLQSISARLSPPIFGGDSSARDHNAWLTRRINAHLERPAPAIAASAPKPETPPGSPIGASFLETCWHCDPITDAND